MDHIQTDAIRSLGSQQGSAFIEFSVVLWFLVLLLFGSVELGNALVQYFTLSDIAYETARAASMIEGLEAEGSLAHYPDSQNIKRCREQLEEVLHLEAHDCAFVVAQLRARALLRSVLPGLSPEQLDVQIALSEGNTVAATIKTPLNASFSPLRRIPIWTSYSLPYLAGRRALEEE